MLDLNTHLGAVCLQGVDGDPDSPVNASLLVDGPVPRVATAESKRGVVGGDPVGRPARRRRAWRQGWKCRQVRRRASESSKCEKLEGDRLEPEEQSG